MSKALEAFRTISEVADDLDVPKHVLRFWEVKFPQIRPMKRGGGRRYYRPEDLILLRGIQHLLHAQGYTIRGVQKILREQGVEQVKQHGLAATSEAPPASKGARASTAERLGAVMETGTGRLRALPKAIKSASAPLSAAHRTALESAVTELEACRAALSPAKPLPEARTRTSRSARPAR